MPRILILEDDPARALRMQQATRSLPLQIDLQSCDSAHAFIDAFNSYAADIVLVSHDHDLHNSTCPTDPGDGRVVSEYLRTLLPTCPVIVHSSNYMMASVMIDHLRNAGWPVTAIAPHSQEALEWIEKDWLPELRRILTHFM